jgi:hypothetical protein
MILALCFFQGARKIPASQKRAEGTEEFKNTVDLTVLHVLFIDIIKVT